MPPGVPTVMIDFLPAANVTTMATCVGPPDVIVKGSAGVMINFLPAARMGDMTAHGGVIVLGSMTCMIGEIGAPSPGAGGMGGVMAGMAVAGLSSTSSKNAIDLAKPASLENSQFNGVKADRVRPGTNGKVAVIGRSMDNAVNPYAQGLQGETGEGIETFSGDQISPGAVTAWNTLKKQYAPDPIPPDVVQDSQMYQDNQAWAQKLADQGYTVVDVDNPGGQADSPFYEMEKQTLFGGDAGGGAGGSGAGAD